MIINCARCNRPFQSAMVDPEQAWKELLLHLTKHVETKHPNTFRRVTEKELPRAIMALTEVYTVDSLVVVPESEEWIQQHISDQEDIVMMSIGYDPEDEDQIEDDDDEDEGQEPILIPTSDPEVDLPEEESTGSD
jgi:hypothetical protein